jgi:hypothetical protein
LLSKMPRKDALAGVAARGPATGGSATGGPDA